MKQFIYLSAACIIALSACTGSFKKGDKGLEYKIISSGSGKTVGYGEFMQIHIKQVYAGTKDTVLMDSYDIMPRVQVLDSISTPLAYFKILKQMKKGDSLVIRLLTDTIFSDPKNAMPPFMKKGKYIYTHVKMVNIFTSQLQADSANAAEAALAKPRIYKKQIEEVEKDLATKKAQLDSESKVIEAYLAKNNIKAIKGKWGTFIAISAEGAGEKITNNDVAIVNYTGRVMDSTTVFDSNIDPKFMHVQPLEVDMTQLGGIIMGWVDALKELKKGSKATVYIPSVLGYGPAGNGEKIKPNQNLTFDMEVTDVVNADAYMAKQRAIQEELMRKAQQQTQPTPKADDKK